MGFRVMGVTEEGHCEHCGAACPRRRMIVVPTDADGNLSGSPQSWGVVCASKARSGSATVSRGASDVFWKFARAVDRVRHLVANGDGLGEIPNLSADGRLRGAIHTAVRGGFPWEIRDNAVRLWADARGGEPDAVVPLA
jgi:hypothetical protein